MASKIAYQTIVKAKAGDDEAMDMILNHYSPYIALCSERPFFDQYGNRYGFVVEWFVEQGVEVWSAMEGQQRFDTHVDKLMNYIRYWQASGESIKTSIRVKTRLEQLTECGYYTGGAVPYGYRLIKQGRMNKRNKEVNDIVIDEMPHRSFG